MTRLRAFAMSGLFLAGTASAQEGTSEVTLMSAAHAVGTLTREEPRAARTFDVDAATQVVFVVTSPVALTVEVGLPDGSSLSERTANGEDRQVFRLWVRDQSELMLPGIGGGDNTLVRIARPPAGPYELRLSAIEPVATATPFAITMLPTSDVRLGVAIPQPEIVLGGGIAVSAVAFQGERPLVETTVTARIALAPDRADAPVPPVAIVKLHDDGREGDAEAGDGVYTGVFVPEASGSYVVLVQAEGVTRDGLGFQRDVGGAFRVTEPTAPATGASAR
jgi:hypothetical protein